MNVEPPETLVIIDSIVYKSNGFAISILDMAEKWISLFFNRRWTRINADARRDLALLIVKRARSFLNLAQKGSSLFQVSPKILLNYRINADIIAHLFL